MSTPIEQARKIETEYRNADFALTHDEAVLFDTLVSLLAHAEALEKALRGLAKFTGGYMEGYGVSARTAGKRIAPFLDRLDA